MEIDHYCNLFERQYGDLPAGGFINPKITEKTDTDIIFKCHYDNYDSDDNCWYYGFEINTQQFYEA